MVTVGESDDTLSSPWSGDVPVPAAPVEFTWARPGERDIAPSVLDAPDEQLPSSVSTPNSDRRRWAIGSVAAVILLMLGWLLIGRGGSSDNLDNADTSTPAEAPGDTNVDGSLLTAETTIPSEPADEAGADSNPRTPTNGSAEWREAVVELPPVLLASSVPFEVVALNSMGDYVEVSIPSGEVNLMEVGRGIDGRVVAGDTATLFVSYSSTRGGRLLRDGEPSVELALPSNVDTSNVRVNGNEFTGVSYGNNGEQNLVRVLANGGVVTTSSDDADFGTRARPSATDSSALVSEAGGIYREGPDGFERISTGFLISASTDHALVRECNESMECGYATIKLDNGERVEAVIANDELDSIGFDSGRLSPDGRWLRYVAFGVSPTEMLIDLTTGERTELEFTDLGGNGRVWAADSSGFFRQSLAEGFEFYVVATGETVAFGGQLGRMVSFDIRFTAGTADLRDLQPPKTGVELIALTAAGDVAEIDVDSGTVIITDGPGIDSNAPITILPDAAGATFVSYDNVPYIRFIASVGSVLAVNGPSPSGALWPGPASGSVWQAREPGDDAPLALDLVDAQGTPLGETIDFDTLGLGGIVGSDGRGGVLAKSGLGGVFALSGTGEPERITSGELLAIDANVAYVRECDDALQCGEFAVDRTTGNRSSVDNTGLTRAGDIVGRGVPTGQNVSPDGTIAFVRDGGDPTRCLMIDTTAGRDSWTGVPCVDVASPIIWTPDSSYVLWLDEGRVTIYERSTRSVRLVNTVKLSAIAALPR